MTNGGDDQFEATRGGGRGGGEGGERGWWEERRVRKGSRREMVKAQEGKGRQESDLE